MNGIKLELNKKLILRTNIEHIMKMCIITFGNTNDFQHEKVCRVPFLVINMQTFHLVYKGRLYCINKCVALLINTHYFTHLDLKELKIDKTLINN